MIAIFGGVCAMAVTFTAIALGLGIAGEITSWFVFVVLASAAVAIRARIEFGAWR